MRYDSFCIFILSPRKTQTSFSWDIWHSIPDSFVLVTQYQHAKSNNGYRKTPTRTNCSIHINHVTNTIKKKSNLYIPNFPPLPAQMDTSPPNALISRCQTASYSLPSFYPAILLRLQHPHLLLVPNTPHIDRDPRDDNTAKGSNDYTDNGAGAEATFTAGRGVCGGSCCRG